MCCPSLPQPVGFGWEKREDRWIPVMTKEAPAPEAIVQLRSSATTVKRIDAQTIDVTSVLAVTVMIPVKMHVKIPIH